MKRKTAVFFLAFASLMMLVHAVLPHHHHCHQVVFSAGCTLEAEETGFPEAAFQLVQAKSCGQDCNGGHDHPAQGQGDPCWKNSKYINPSCSNLLPTPQDAPNFLADNSFQEGQLRLPPIAGFFAYLPSHSDFSLLYQSFLAGTRALRAPPVA